MSEFDVPYALLLLGGICALYALARFIRRFRRQLS
jgi:hypothetical protein